jgi:hypothetical protein
VGDLTKDVYELFIDPLAQAIAEGRKLVTRRPIAARNSHVWITDEAGRREITGSTASSYIRSAQAGNGSPELVDGVLILWPRRVAGKYTLPEISVTPRAESGDTLVVRECFRTSPPIYGVGPDRVSYRACYTQNQAAQYAWRPSIHMPSWAARSTPRIVSVTPERVGPLSQAEAELEGFDSPEEFAAVWEALYPEVRWCWRTQFEGPPT